MATRSAIGEFSVHVAAELAKLADVEIWTSDDRPHHNTSLPVVTYSPDARDLVLLEQRDAIVYNMGDYLPFHGHMHAVADRYPGVVILHDRVMHHLYAGLWLMGDDAAGGVQTYVNRMRTYYGHRGYVAARRSLAGRRRPIWESDNDVLDFPLYEEAIAAARAVVTHSDEQASAVAARWHGPVRALKLPCYREVLAKAESSTADSDGASRLQLLTVGHVNPNKQVDRFVAVLAANPDIAAKVRYVVVGPDDGFKDYVAALRSFVASQDSELCVEMLGWQPEEALDQLMANADIFVNLRHPVMEGCSATLMRQLAYGRPILCFDDGCFGEMPPDALARVSSGDFDALASALRELVDDPARRLAIGRRARSEAQTRDERAYAEALRDVVCESKKAAPALRFIDAVARELGGLGVHPGLAIFDEVANDFGRIFES